ncbi:MAG: carotenoid oxygenase family protein [Pseudomonadota bacterium]
MLDFIRKIVSSGDNRRYAPVPFAPVQREMTVENLEVDGTIPPELSGLYVRNGPNTAGETGPHQHYFSGDGMLHGVFIEDGQAKWYRNRFVNVGAVPKKRGTQDPGGPVTTGLDISPNTNVVQFADKLYATIEAGASMAEITRELDTVARADLDGVLTDGFTGHHKIDPVHHDIHAVTYSSKIGPNALYQRLTPTGEVLNRITVPLSGMTQIHDMSITENYAIIFDLSVVFSPWALVKTSLPIIWDGKKEARIGVIPKAGRAEDVRWFNVAPCYAYHAMNAFETANGDVIVDVSRYERSSEKDMYGPLGDTEATIDRWVCPMSGTETEAREERVFDLPLDFPKISPLVEGRPYRFGYSVEATLVPSFDRAVKLDFETGATQYQAFNGGMSSELTFIPKAGRGDDAPEDAGWLMGFVFQPEHERSRLVIVDAQDFEADPVASIWIPEQYVPIGTHGGWFTDR